MAQKNKVSVATIEQVMKDQFPADVKTVEWCGIEIEYKEFLSMVEMKAFVDSVVEGCFDKDGDYIPEFKEWLIRTNMIQLYTNVRMPQNIEKQYDILYRSDLFDLIVQLVDHMQYYQIVATIDEKLVYRTNADIAALKSQLAGLIKQFEGIGQDLMQFTPDEIQNLESALDLMKEAGMDRLQGEIEHQEDKGNKIVPIFEDDG